MEGFEDLVVSDVSSLIRKKRSNSSRRPRNEPLVPLHNQDNSPPSEVSEGSSSDNDGYGPSIKRKEVNVLCSSRASFSNNADYESSKSAIKNEHRGFVDSDESSNSGSFRGSNEQKHSGVESKGCSQGVLAPVNWTSPSDALQFDSVSDYFDNENKVKMVKLKVGGVTRTIRTKSISDGASAVGSSTTKASRVSDAHQPRQQLNQDSNENCSFTLDKEPDEQEGMRKDSRSVSIIWKANSLELNDNRKADEMDKSEPVRKSKRISKRCFTDDALDDGDEVKEEYLEKLRTSRFSKDYSAEHKERESRRQRQTLKALKRNSEAQYDIDMRDYGPSKSRKNAKSRSGSVLDDIVYDKKEESILDDELSCKTKKPRKELVNLIVDQRNEVMVTTRRRALHTAKDVASSLVAPLIEFSDGLPPAPTRKQKEKPSELQQQLKKAEAAQRRRIQVEKAARESEAEAIRKILGQDSSRKKREEKIRKHREDIALERAANAMILASETVRWVMGPSGTTVTFPNDMAFPTIFDTKPCCYPPPREKCAGPSCTNPYKYRDSESKLPLCSLRCYKAVHEKMRQLTAY